MDHYHHYYYYHLCVCAPSEAREQHWEWTLWSSFCPCTFAWALGMEYKVPRLPSKQLLYLQTHLTGLKMVIFILCVYKFRQTLFIAKTIDYKTIGFSAHRWMCFLWAHHSGRQCMYTEESGWGGTYPIYNPHEEIMQEGRWVQANLGYQVRTRRNLNRKKKQKEKGKEIMLIIIIYHDCDYDYWDSILLCSQGLSPTWSNPTAWAFWLLGLQPWITLSG